MAIIIHHPALEAESVLPDDTPDEALTEYFDKGWERGIGPWHDNDDLGNPPPPPEVAHAQHLARIVITKDRDGLGLVPTTEPTPSPRKASAQRRTTNRRK